MYKFFLFFGLLFTLVLQNGCLHTNDVDNTDIEYYDK